MEKAIKELLKKLEDSDGRVREEAHWALIDMGKEVVPYVVPLLKHPNPVVRWEAAFILSELAPPEAAEALVEALEDESESVRWLAAEALINIGKPALRPLLRALVERGSQSVRLREGARIVLRGLKVEYPYLPIDELIRELNGLHFGQIPTPSRIPQLAYEVLKQLEETV